MTGLRGLAILMVVSFHMGAPLPEGGPAGVTVFFVLSGFLITSLLTREMTATGRVDLRRFYLSRARRLFPALAAVVGVVSAVALLAGQLEAMAGDSLLALTHLSNWARASGDLMGVWNHTWSLAIEEQFYLIWPALFIPLALAVGPRSWTFVAVLVALAASSALLRVTLSVGGVTDERIYFGSDTRAEALFAGCALAAFLGRRPSWGLPTWLGPLAIGMVLLLSAGPSQTWLWPGAFFSMITASTCLVIVGALRTGRQWMGLDSRPMVWLGERSYSLYLWHVPALLFLTPALDGTGPLVQAAVPALVSVMLAEASYRVIEQPFRLRRTHAVVVTENSWTRRVVRRPTDSASRDSPQPIGPAG